MANTRKRRPIEPPHASLDASLNSFYGRVAATLDAALGGKPVSLRLGLSGGIDSVVLLDVLAPYAAAHGHRLECMHVHHGLSPNADAWAAFCETLCARYDIACTVVRVDLRPYRGLGTEGAARAARYAALNAGAIDFVVLAHQRNDQAETVLLHLARGAGVMGLAAMPPAHRQGEGLPVLLRPMLDSGRDEIVAHAQSRGLRWVEDESNADTGLARNFTRLRVLPLLEELNPAAITNAARAAGHLREAQTLLDEMAAMDAGEQQPPEALDLNRLAVLSDPRARNVLRWWLGGRAGTLPGSAELGEALRQLRHARQDAGIALHFGDRVLRRYRDRALLEPRIAAPAADFAARFCADWQGEAAWPLPELGGSLYFEAVRGRGLRSELLRPGAVTVRLRRGGERLRVRPGGPSRSLKNLLQEQGVAPHSRTRLPLLYCGEELAYVPHVGVAAHLCAGPEEVGVEVQWCPTAR